MSDKTEGSCVRLDDFFADKELTFVKADIESAEPAMLRGGCEVFATKVRAALVCQYHTPTDERTIKGIMDEYGFSYRDNSGYMLIDPRKAPEPYLRRGVLYAYR